MDPEELASLPIEDSFDLHSFLPKDVVSVVSEYLDAAKARFREVRLIHGRGIGVQREIVRSVLSRRGDVAQFFDAPPERGGWGATVVVFRPEKAFPFAIEEKTLGNGLRLYAIRYDSPGLIAYYSVVRTGSRNEVEAGHTGFAHFFEHMMFRGTEKFPTDKYNDIVREIGADSNAYTDDDLTCYHLLAGRESLPTIMEIESDRFQNLDYGVPEFQKEARAVLGEYNVGASNPFQPMEEKLRDLAFTAHTYKHTTIGFLKDIERMPGEYEYSRRFFELYYRPDNVQIVVAGDVDPAQFFGLAEKHYGGWTRGPAPPEVPAEPPQKREERATVAWKSATLPILLIAYHVPAYSTRTLDGAALDVLAELLFADRAPLHKRLVLSEQRVEDMGGGVPPRRDPGLFEVYARVKKSEDVPAVEQAIEEEIARIAAHPPEEDALAEAVAHLRYAFAGSLSTADAVANAAASAIAVAGDIASINDYYALYDRLTPADVSASARKHFAAENRTVVSLQPPAARDEGKE